MLKKLSLISILALSACASGDPHHKSGSTYVAPDYYSDYNCNQLKAERTRLGTKIEQMTESEATDTTEQVLTTAVMALAITKGYGYRKDKEDNTEFKRMTNQYEVLEQERIKKECF